MRAAEYLNDCLKQGAARLGLDWPAKVVTQPPKERKFGDLACNAALLLAKSAGRPPRELAGELAAFLANDPLIAAVDVAGAGFINVRFAPAFWHGVVREVLERRDRFGAVAAGPNPKRVQVEFVSANPTGPLHIGHGRGAAVGDSLARLLEFTGHAVEREYYINDAGRQMKTLGNSVWVRVLELAGQHPEIPEEFYKGDYIKDIARKLLAENPNLPALAPEAGREVCFEFAHRLILDGIKQDLAAFRVEIQSWASERAILESGAVDDVLSRFAAADLLFEADDALWFRSSRFGDDKDRVLRKSGGDLTYVTTDIAYHEQKYQRGFDLLVDVWGADHHGYIPRMRAALQALGHDPAAFQVIIIQLVNWLKGGEQIAMSTRAGQFETLADVLAEVGADAARFMFLSRKSDSPLDFDLDLVKSQSMDNPVYYVQYAHARICNVFAKALERGLVAGPYDSLSAADFTDSGAEADSASGDATGRAAAAFPDLLAPLAAEDDLELIRRLEQYPGLLLESAGQLAPHHISFYLMELAAALHRYYAAVPVLNAPEPGLVRARLALLAAVGHVLKGGLALLGVSAPEKM